MSFLIVISTACTLFVVMQYINKPVFQLLFHVSESRSLWRPKFRDAAVIVGTLVAESWFTDPQTPSPLGIQYIRVVYKCRNKLLYSSLHQYLNTQIWGWAIVERCRHDSGMTPSVKVTITGA